MNTHLLDQLFPANELYKKIFELSPEAIVILDHSGRIVEMNNRTTDWLGYPKRELLHKHLLQLPFFSLQSKEIVVKNFLKRIAGIKPAEYSVEFITKDKKIKIGKIRGETIKDAAGKVVGDLVMVTEVTKEHFKTEGLMRKEKILEAVNYSARYFLRSHATEQDYQKVLQSIGESASASRVVLVINDLLGQRYEWLSKGIKGVLQDEQYPNLFVKQGAFTGIVKDLKANKVVVAKRSDFKAEARQILDRFHVLSLVLNPIFVNKKWWAYLCIQDCSEERIWLKQELDALSVATKIIAAAMERNLMELKLRETVGYLKHERDRVSQEVANTKKFKQAVESATDGIMILSTGRKLMYVNPALETMTGFLSQELDGKFPDFLNPDKTPRQILMRMWQDIEHHGTSTSDEVMVLKKNGEDLPVRLSVFAVEENGMQQFFVGLLEDITERKEIEQMKTEFISIASHQLNTPLSAMKWFLDLLQTGKAGQMNQKQQDFVQNIADSNTRMIALVRSLLNISRIESGRIIIDPRLTDVKKLIDDVIKEVIPFTARRNQKVNVEVDEKVHKVLLDPRLIRNVYLNLLTNASKYSPEKTQIEVQVFIQGEELVSHVVDHGYGIPSVAKNKIFTKFFRADNVVKMQVDGSGLGMYLVKIVVESSGGKIWLNSEENKGTDVGFSLPLAGIKKKAGDVYLDQNAYS